MCYKTVHFNILSSNEWQNFYSLFNIILTGHNTPVHIKVQVNMTPSQFFKS